MAEQDDKFSFDESINYYSILGVSKNATNEEIKNAYHRLCVIYHPDKHLDQEKKLSATKIFSSINLAFNILSDSKKRQIYDEFGSKGVEMAMQIGEYLGDDLNRLKEELERQRLGWTNKTIISNTLDASYLMEDLSPIANQVTWYDKIPTFNAFALSHRIDTSLDEKTIITCLQSIATKGSSGTGVLQTIISRQFNSRIRGRIDLACGSQKRLGIGLTFALTNKMSLDLMLFSQFYGGAFDLNGHLTCTHAISEKYITHSTLSNDHVSFGLQKLSDTNPFYMGTDVNFQGSMSFNGKLIVPISPHIRIKVKTGSFPSGPTSFALINEDKGKKKSIAFEIGPYFGFGFRLGYSIGNLQFILPIFISREISHESILWGIGLPTICSFMFYNFIAIPFQRYKRKEYFREFNLKQKFFIQKQRENVEMAIELMRPFYDRRISSENSINGLIIKRAIYTTIVKDFSLDVSIPLQMMIVDSHLSINTPNIHDILGFYDIAPGIQKILNIDYLFRGIQHRAEFSESDSILLPLRSHVIC